MLKIVTPFSRARIYVAVFTAQLGYFPAAQAQNPPPQEVTDEFDVYEIKDEVIATGVKQGGFTETDNVLPDVVFSGRDILALGVADIGEFIDAISAETQSTSDEPPVFLLDGRPVASKRDIKRFPAEAVKRVEVLSSEAALKFTSDASRRVLNFKLRRRFNAITSNVKARTTTDGGGTFGSLGVDTLKIQNKVRFAVNASYERQNNLTQAQRNIPAQNLRGPFSLGGTITAPNQIDEIDPAFSDLAGQTVTIAAVPDAARMGSATLRDFLLGVDQFLSIDPQEVRDLKPQKETLTLGANLFKPIGDNLSASGSLHAELSSTYSQSGLIGSRFTIAPDNPFSPFAETISLHRYDGPIKRKNTNDDIEGNLALYGDYQDWRWSLEGQYNHIADARKSTLNAGTQFIQQSFDQNDFALNPFGVLPILENTENDSTEKNFLVKLGVSGKVATLSAGDVTGSVRLEYADGILDAIGINSNGRDETKLSRQSAKASSEVSIPLLGKHGARRAAGKLSLRLSSSIQTMDGFDTLSTYGTGLNWNVTNKLQIKGDFGVRERAPKLAQLGSPILIDSNIRVTDFDVGNSVFIDRITGGNPDLDAEQRRDFQLSARYRHNRNLSFNTRYQIRTTDNAISSFPFLTPQVAVAFPERLFRNDRGSLISLDARPVNAFRTEQTSLRSGINWTKRSIARVGTKWPRDQISLSLYHTWRLEDKFQFREQGPVFDLLGGAALRRQGGEPKHDLQARLNFRRKNYGATLLGTFETGTRIDVSSLPGNQGRNGDLNLNPLAKADMRFYYDLGRRPNGRKVKRKNWRRDLRISLELKNITNSKQSAVNGLGETPFGYEEDALDPFGRTIMLSLRKVNFK